MIRPMPDSNSSARYRTCRRSRSRPERRLAIRWPVLALGVFVALSGVVAPAAGVTTAADSDLGGAGQFQVGPTANLTATPDPANPGEPVVLDATASSAPAGDEVVQCEFDVDGDGTYDDSASECRLETSYSAVGEYVPTVRVLTGSSGSATASEPLVVAENVPPRAVVDVEPADPRPNETVTLSATGSTDPDGAVVEFLWQVDGRSLTGETVATSFEAAGTYEVTLLVRDDDGAENLTTTAITVGDARPPAAALDVAPAQPTVGEDVTLDAGASEAGVAPIAEYRWDLDGDGTIDRTTGEPQTTVTVVDPGEHTVGVTVVDDRGVTAGTTRQFAVAPAGTEPGGNGAADESTDPGAGAETDSPGLLDPGVVPFVPDWLGLLLVVVLVGVTGVVVRRRDAVRSRLHRARERLGRGTTRRKLARKVSGFLSKTVFKRTLRALADAVEFSGRTVGDGFERMGRWLRRGSKRVADALRRLGG